MLSSSSMIDHYHCMSYSCTLHWQPRHQYEERITPKYRKTFPDSTVGNRDVDWVATDSLWVGIWRSTLLSTDKYSNNHCGSCLFPRPKIVWNKKSWISNKMSWEVSRILEVVLRTLQDLKSYLRILLIGFFKNFQGGEIDNYHHCFLP